LQENPVVAVLDHDLQGKGTHCSHCLRHIQTGMAIRPPSDRLDSVYCSKECQVKAKSHYQNLLFNLESPLPFEMSPALPQKMVEQRDMAQAAFVNYLKQTVNAAPLLVAKFIGRQVAIETAKMTPVPTNIGTADFPEHEAGDYTLYDHVERLRYLELSAPQEEMKLLRDVLQNTLPGLEQFVTEERHATLLGKMSYNSYGVCFGGGRDDKVLSNSSWIVLRI
jgi:import receptor subunit TOM20